MLLVEAVKPTTTMSRKPNQSRPFTMKMELSGLTRCMTGWCCHTHAVFLHNTPSPTQLLSMILQVCLFFKIYCLSLIRMHRAPESVCRNNYPRACMCLWQTVCTCESGGASRVTTQVCEWTRGSPVARWKPNLCNCRWFSFGVCCPQVAKDEYCSLHAAKCNVCTGKYNEWYYRQPPPFFYFFFKKENKERKKRG